MSTQIGPYIVSGELRNTRRNAVFGWIEFGPQYGVRIELTGNMSGMLEGKHIRFQSTNAGADTAHAEHSAETAPAYHEQPAELDIPKPSDLPEKVETLSNRQIGVTGQMRLINKLMPSLPMKEWESLSPEEQQQRLVEKQCLSLEWYSQNGHVTAELIDPLVVYIEGDEAPLDADDDEHPLIDNLISVEEDGDDLEDEESSFLDDDDLEEDIDDPFGLFGQDLDEMVAESLGQEGESSDPQRAQESKPWDEVIPGIDPETKAMYEQWDEIFEGKKDEPISYLFAEPLKLPTIENVHSDEQAEPLVRAILAQLALLSVALDVCEHFSALDTYKLLMQDILPTAKVHPQLAENDMVQHYSTSDYCSACDAESSAEESESQED